MESYRTTNLSTTLCVNDSKMNKMMYHYDYCDKDFIGQQRTSYTVGCHCIRNTITDCRPYMYLYDKCNTIFISLLSIQLLVIVVGIALNFIIILRFFRNSSIQKQRSNILLLNQAVADMVNCLVYLTPLIVTHFHNVTYSEYSSIIDLMFTFGAFLSFRSSLCIFLVIAFERYLAIAKPIWHRVNLREKHIWRLNVITWAIAMITAAIACSLLSNGEIAIFFNYLKVSQAIDIIQIVIITILFVLTFYKALTYIRRRNISGIVLFQKRKELHLTAIFSLMYILFILCFFPLTIGNAFTKSPENRLKILGFSLTSIINPILTLKLRKGFRVGSKLNENRSSDSMAAVVVATIPIEVITVSQL